MATQLRSLFLSALLLSSCSLLDIDRDTAAERFESKTEDEPTLFDLQSEELKNVPIPEASPIVAVYTNSFTDQTGQRKSNSQFALFSTAVTQAPSNLLIRSLKHAGDGKFFRVVERIGLDNLTKERQLIRSAREQFEGDDGKKPLMPLLFAGVILEGAVLGYDTNLVSGGIGARYLGVGNSAMYRKDTVTISLRMVSVSTGEVLIEVSVQKTIFSYGKSQDVFKFIEAGTELVEIEIGSAKNESTTIALMKAIETGVLEIINVGYEKGFWVLQSENNQVE